MRMKQPNILLMMCDQLRADSIGAYGNGIVRTPHLDRLAQRGLVYQRAYSSCPVCVPARYTIRTGREPYNTGYYDNGGFQPPTGQPANHEERCGAYLPRTMAQLGYRTFGVGKFHTDPWDEELGYEVQLRSEELFDTPEQEAGDDYARYIRERHPEYAHIDQLHGERTDMYYMPQVSPLPARLTVEAWVADQAVELINNHTDHRPYFGFVSFIGPHPPLAPPVPFNRMYNPDAMPNPVRGDRDVDFMDEQLPWMNHLIWAEDIDDPRARALKARYYGEITYIDQCVGRILDAVESRGDADNTLIVFFSDHGDHMGDHHAWQKESFFEASARVPFFLSWPERITSHGKRDDLVCLTDLFAIATHAAGRTETRDGVDVLGILKGVSSPREYLFGWYGQPGKPTFKLMVRHADWKYIYMSNGGREQLFHLGEDPQELVELSGRHPDIAADLRRVAAEEAARHPALAPAMSGSSLRSYPFAERPLTRIRQFNLARGVSDFDVN
ncbi:sulfatase [Paenibacillus sp. GCM10023248]|uniref:sulfatase family protein n=1 Tax=unclassified Paenibacillus TaxID=185978 RepID=UPI002379A1C2|nr:sulfatase-like hydrolase/transferase [Paenibacillus sp. MAHUQ-63]MDD9269434.1 sulfatase-like hydrolase/transferase [Paenibacillus sp. MAHUQ-63]